MYAALFYPHNSQKEVLSFLVINKETKDKTIPKATQPVAELGFQAEGCQSIIEDGGCFISN